MRAKASVAVLVLLLAACASSPQVRQFQALGTCDAIALSGAKTFGIYYQAHKAEDAALWADRYDKANAAYVSYQKIGNAAQAAMESGGDQTLLLAAVNEALNQYLALLATFGVKPTYGVNK